MKKNAYGSRLLVLPVYYMSEKSKIWDCKSYEFQIFKIINVNI